MVNRLRTTVAKLPAGMPNVPAFDGENKIEAGKEATAFLKRFTDAVEQGDWQAFGDLFDNDTAFWRDSLTLTFDKRTLRGKEDIVKAWKQLSGTRKPSAFSSQKADTWSMEPQFVRLAPTLASLDVPFSFTTDAPKSKCIGLAKLIPKDGQWKIWILATAIGSLNDHPFSSLPRKSPSLIQDSQRGRAQAQGLPQVKGILDAVVVGANASGLANTIMLDSTGANVAAFDQEPIVGSTWARSRYQNLTLHHPAFMIQLPLFPVPGDFPKYLTGDDLARYYESAISELNLPVFGGIKVVSNTYNEAEELWRVQIKDIQTGDETVVEAKNIVMCNGFLVSPDNPLFPNVTDQHLFKGPIQHTTQYRTPAPYMDKDVIIVGSGNSAHDVAQNLTLGGAKSVTILQRSPTVLLDFESFGNMVAARYQGDIPVDTADFLETSIPTCVLRDMARGMLSYLIEAQGDRNAEFENAGYMLDRAPCLVSRAFDERGRSFYVDQPKTFDLVLGGQIKVARGEAKRFVEEGLVVYDKGEGVEKVLKADGVVYATGYDYVDLPKRFADSGFVDAKSARMLENVSLLGVDTEGEFPGYITASGHPHLYFSAIGFINARWIAKYTAIQVMADVTGSFPKRYQRDLA